MKPSNNNSIVASFVSWSQDKLVFLLLFTCSFVVSVLGRFLFLLVLGIDCAFLLWHSLGLQLIISHEIVGYLV